LGLLHKPKELTVISVTQLGMREQLKVVRRLGGAASQPSAGNSTLWRKIEAKITAAFAFGPVTVRLSPRLATVIVSRFARAGGEIVRRVSPI
jgi:hypothetical protein